MDIEILPQILLGSSPEVPKSDGLPAALISINAESHKPSSLVDSDPPIALDKFIEASGLSAVTLWRYRRAGWLTTVNIAGRHYVTRSEIARFNVRAAAGEFAKRPTTPTHTAKQGSLGYRKEEE